MAYYNWPCNGGPPQTSQQSSINGSISERPERYFTPYPSNPPLPDFNLYTPPASTLDSQLAQEPACSDSPEEDGLENDADDTTFERLRSEVQELRRYKALATKRASHLEVKVEVLEDMLRANQL